MLFNEITESAIKRAIQSPSQIDMNLVNAQQARRVLDRIVGYKGSQLLWTKVRRGLSMGRVQSVAVKLICDREAEREAFRSQEYWSITATLAGTNPPPFAAKLHSVNGQDAVISSAEDANRIVEAVQGKEFLIRSLERREKRRNPAAPFITSRLQQEAARKLRYTSKKTMTLAQQLYEGVEIGKEGLLGLITYMRTDSPRISSEAAEEAKQVISNRYGINYLPATPNVYKTQKAALYGPGRPCSLKVPRQPAVPGVRIAALARDAPQQLEEPARLLAQRVLRHAQRRGHRVLGGDGRGVA